MVEGVTSLSSNGNGNVGISITFDELSMQQTLIFSDTLKDLKTLRSQLYSAAEYFEVAYASEEDDQQRYSVVGNLKEYAVRAVVNTVDHLGSVSFKLSSLIDQRLEELAQAHIRLSCIQQRTGTSQAYMDSEGLSQQSLVITAPKFHKRYILPSDSVPNTVVQNAVPNLREMNIMKKRSGEMLHVHNNAAAAPPKTKERLPSFRKLGSIARAPSQRARSSSPSEAGMRTTRAGAAAAEKRSDPAISFASADNPLTRSASLARKPSLLKTSSVGVQQAVLNSGSEPKKLGSLRLHAERNEDEKEFGGEQQTPKKSRKFLKSLLSRRKSRKDDPTHAYLDDC